MGVRILSGWAQKVRAARLQLKYGGARNNTLKSFIMHHVVWTKLATREGMFHATISWLVRSLTRQHIFTPRRRTSAASQDRQVVVVAVVGLQNCSPHPSRILWI